MAESKRSRESEEEVWSDVWRAVPCPFALLSSVVPHDVVPQLLRPVVGCYHPRGQIVCRSRSDAEAAATGVELHDKSMADPASLHEICDLPNLTLIDVSHCAIGVPFLEEVPKQLPHLQGLSVAFCSNVAADMEQCLRIVGSLVNLRTLDISGLGDPENEDTVDFPSLPSLRQLHITGSCGGIQFPLLPALRSLDLCCSSGDDIIPLPEAVPDLTELCLRFFKAADLWQVVTLSSLRKLMLRDVNQLSARALSGLPALEELDVSSCWQLSLDGISTALPSLRSLDLSSCGIKDVHLSHLAGMPLRFLSLRCNHITADGLKTVSALADLRDLDVTGCRSISATDVHRLVALPALRHGA